MSDSTYMFGQWAADDDGAASESAQAEYEQQARAEDDELTRAEQEEIYGGPLPEGLTIRKFTDEEIAALDAVGQREVDLLSVAVREFADKHGITLVDDEPEDIDPVTELSHQARYHLGEDG